MLVASLISSLPIVGVYAQTKAVTGTVMADNQALPGATVVEKGTTNGTVTDADGKFSISVNDGAILLISFIGMKPTEVPVGNQSNVTVTLEADVTQLDELVVIGYGEVSRHELTSSVSSVSARQLRDVTVNNTAQSLAGRLAGVQVVTSEGTPNAQVNIRVRGGGSITQDNTPLYVVDGIQVENALSVIAAQDIESIDVLKDASATAIYGARGANGVVIITTKGGREMKTVVTYSGQVGVRQLANKLDVMKPYDFVFYQYERSRGSTAGENAFRDMYGHFGDLDLYNEVPFIDWQEKVFGRNALMQTHNVAITGGTSGTNYNLSITSQGEEGIMINSDFDRKLLNFRFDHKVNKYLRAGFNVRYNNTVVNGAGTSSPGSSSVNRLRQAVKYKPVLFPGQSTDTYDPDYAAATNANSLSLVNPILLSAAEYQQDRSSVANLNGSITIEPVTWLSFRSTLGFDITNQRVNVFNDTITNASKLNGASQPIASINTITRNTLNNSNVVTFSAGKLSPAFAENNKLDVLLGQETFQTSNKSYFIESRLFPVGITPERALGNMALGTPQIPTSSEVNSTLLSFFGRASYSFREKYMAVLTFRRDGSSKFAEGHKWGNFPSASLAWRISGENFMQNTTRYLSDLKLRVSYGQAGNNRIGDFLYLTQFNSNAFYDQNNQLVTGYNPAGLANDNLKWETTTSRNIGLDAAFLNNRIQLTVDAYRNTTEDLLLSTPVPTSSGYTTQIQNVGSTSNRGVEIQLSGTPVRRNKFAWNASFNISFFRNKVESLGDQDQFLFSSGWAGGNAPFDYAVIVGRPVGTIWGLETDGFYTIDDFDFSNGVYTLKAGIPNDQGITAIAPRPGILKFIDQDGNGLIDDKDRTDLGSATPKFFGGFNNMFTYGNFDLSVFLNFQYGNKVLNANKLEFTSGYTPNANLLSIMNDRWRNVDAEGNVVTDPGALATLNEGAKLWTPLTSASSFYVHSWAVEDGSFIRVNNVTLGYSLPAGLLEKARITKLRIYATVNNLAVFTKYSGYDPDVNTRRNSPITPGVDYSAYPRSHAYMAGINLSF